jgi:hypothetical protein
MRARQMVTVLLGAALLAGCGGGGNQHAPSTGTNETSASSGTGVSAGSGGSGASHDAALPFPLLATKNTTRVDSSDPVATAAAVALAVFPSALPGTHPAAVTLAPTDDWQAALAAASLMAPPFRAPLLLSSAVQLPPATAHALATLAPTGDQAAGGAQLIRVGDVPSPPGLQAAEVSGGGPAELAAAIDRFEATQRGAPSSDVIVASADQPSYAMPAAGLAAESGEPILFVTGSGVPGATRTALLTRHHPHIYVLGPPSAIPDTVLSELSALGTVTRVGADGPAANSVLFAEYRDPPCIYGQPCAHIPGSFGWAIRSPGHGYVLINVKRPLDAAAAAALSSSGSYGPQLLIENPNTLPAAVLNYFLDYATPGYAQEGPTAAVYNHAWLIGAASDISLAVQAQVDSLLEAVAQR